MPVEVSCFVVAMNRACFVHSSSFMYYTLLPWIDQKDLKIDILCTEIDLNFTFQNSLQKWKRIKNANTRKIGVLFYLLERDRDLVRTTTIEGLHRCILDGTEAVSQPFPQSGTAAIPDESCTEHVEWVLHHP